VESFLPCKAYSSFLPNLGHSGTMNAAIQCLVPHFLLYLSPSRKNKITRISKLPPFCKLRHILLRPDHKPALSELVQVCTRLDQKLCSRNPVLLKSARRNVTEVYKTLLDYIQAESNPTSDDAAQNFTEKFDLLLQQHTYCASDGVQSVSTVKRNVLALPVLRQGNAVNLETCMSQWTVPLDERCLRCTNALLDSSLHKVTFALQTVPKILVVSLNRFQANLTGNLVKSNCQLHFPLANLSTNCMLPSSVSASSTPLFYNLVGLIFHTGDSLECGHFEAIVYNKDALIWVHYSDLLASHIAPADVNSLQFQSNVCMLFYEMVVR
jgi:ubiquitin C-terminal hydrolase